MKKNYYITTTLPYVNADPHIGFALEIVEADTLARYHRLLGDTVVFNTGTDEHGLKIYRKAIAEGKTPQAYCDEYAAKFHALKDALHLSYTHFIRTTDAHHVAAAQEFWKLCLANGDIYKKNYSVKYCVGCELEKMDSELVDNHCPIHPKLDIELIEEENYFFRWSKYQEPLLAWYHEQTTFVLPENRLREIEAFVSRGLEDFSISRVASKLPWGVPVPDDATQVMYVWFDALVNYISTLGWPFDDTQGRPTSFDQFWPGVQIAGKDNLRQQSAMWAAMLLSARLPLPKQIFIHGFITANGQKMSKSLGNVVNPMDLVEKYGTDAVRYYLLGGIPAHEDGDYSVEKFEEFFDGHLANGIGNLVSRVLTMLEKYSESKVPIVAPDPFGIGSFWQAYHRALDQYAFQDAVAEINRLVKKCDTIISEQKPWAQVKSGHDVQPLLYQLAEAVRHIGLALLPIIPQTAEKILAALGIDPATASLEHDTAWGKLDSGAILKKGEPLFPRL